MHLIKLFSVVLKVTFAGFYALFAIFTKYIDYTCRVGSHHVCAPSNRVVFFQIVSQTFQSILLKTPKKADYFHNLQFAKYTKNLLIVSAICLHRCAYLLLEL